MLKSPLTSVLKVSDILPFHRISDDSQGSLKSGGHLQKNIPNLYPKLLNPVTTNTLPKRAWAKRTEWKEERNENESFQQKCEMLQPKL